MFTPFSISPLEPRHSSNWNKESQVSNPQIVTHFKPCTIVAPFIPLRSAPYSLFWAEIWGKRKDRPNYFVCMCVCDLLSASLQHKLLHEKKYKGEEISHVNTCIIGLLFLLISCFLSATKRVVIFSFFPQ